ncbi:MULTISPECIES: NAD(P)-dependent benzaldehyde dehydrogenase MdlD [Acetobacter]|uniref:NAD(P)-dependent benzaldehyde dehydrogenase MdlD n=1 Tax=Acetobacter TaxID=434 RepID=UPI00376F9293
MDYTPLNKIQNAFDIQTKALREQKLIDIKTRKSALNALHATIEKYANEICSALSEDLGKSELLVKMTEIGVVLEEINHYIKNMDEWAKPQVVPNFPSPLDYKGRAPVQSFIQHEAFGIVYIIGPFNYPFNLVLSPLVGAIAAGNRAIIKPSEAVPHTAKIIEKIVSEAFAPQHVAVVQGGREENEALLKLPFNMIFFTGSPAVGKIVMKAASEHLAPVVLELGGKSPFIVFSDADLERAADQVVQGRFTNSGQTCIAPDYVLVDSSVKDSFLKKVIEKVQHDYPDIGSTGKVVTTTQVKRLLSLIERTKGTVVYGGGADPEARTLQATVVDGVDWSDSLMEQELFGPVLPILTFKNSEDVPTLVNSHHPNPLAAYYFTNDIENGKRMADLISSGDAVINGVMLQVVSPYLAFGGIGASGMGEYHGRSGYEVFTHKKSIVVAG